VLGVSGSALEGDVYGGVGTTTLSTWMYEYGFMGLILFQIFNLWVVVKLFRHARRVSDPYQAALAYGLILFTLFWPVWTWYHKAWIAGVMMILYWIAIGYTFRQIYHPPQPVTTAGNQRVARSH
jgi:cell division protein FtsW (lipid II flippase)